VIVAVDAIDAVSVAALVNGNDTVGVIDAVADQGSMSLVSIATIRSSNSLPRACGVDQFVDLHDVELRGGFHRRSSRDRVVLGLSARVVRP
jgi:hypothetical protein